MLNPIVIHFVPSELLTAFIVACTIVTGAKSSLQWLFSGLPPAVRRHLLTPTLNASPMVPPPSPPVNWTPQPTVTVYKIQYIESLPITSNPYNPFPFSATSSSPFDQWNTPSWASPSDLLYGWDPMVARYAVLLCTVAMVFFMLIAGAFTVYYVAVKAIVGGHIIRRELAEQERLQKTYTSTSVGSDGHTETPAAVYNDNATQIPFNWKVSEGNLIPHTDLSRERGLTARTERKDGCRVRAETTSHTKGKDSLLTRQETVARPDLNRKKPTCRPGTTPRWLPVQLRSEGSVRKETELSHALQALPSASHVQVPPPVTVISSTNTNGRENMDVIPAPSDSMLAEVLNDNGVSENRATAVEHKAEKERPTTPASSNETSTKSVNPVNADTCANGANAIDGLKDVGILHELPSPANVSHVASKAEQLDTVGTSFSQDDCAPLSSRLPDAKAQETLAIHPSVPEGKAVVPEVASETSTRTGAGSSRDDSDVPTTVNGREKKHDTTTVIPPTEPISLEPSMSGLSHPEPSDDGASTVHVNAGDAPETSVPLTRSEEQEKTIDYPAPVTSFTSVSDPKPGPDDQPSGSPQAHDRIGERSLQNDDKAAPSSAQPGYSPTDVGTNQNIQEESKEPGETRQIRKLPKRVLAEKGRNLPRCPVAPVLSQEEINAARFAAQIKEHVERYPVSMFKRYWNDDAGKQDTDAAIPSGSSSVQADGASESGEPTVDPNVEQERQTTPASSSNTTMSLTGSVNHVNSNVCASGSNIIDGRETDCDTAMVMSPAEPTPLEPSSSGLSHSEPSDDDTNGAQVTEGGAPETSLPTTRSEEQKTADLSPPITSSTSVSDTKSSPDDQPTGSPQTHDRTGERSLQNDDKSAPSSAQPGPSPTDVGTNQNCQQESKKSEDRPIVKLRPSRIARAEQMKAEMERKEKAAKVQAEMALAERTDVAMAKRAAMQLAAEWAKNSCHVPPQGPSSSESGGQPATPASLNDNTRSVDHDNGNAHASGLNVIDGTENECDTSAGTPPTEPASLEPSSSGLSHYEPSDDDNSAPSSVQQDSASTDVATSQNVQETKKLSKNQRKKAKKKSKILPSVPQPGPSAEARPAALAEQTVGEGFVAMSEKKAGKQRAVTIPA